MPLDISYPQALLEDILEDAKPVSVISFKELQPRLHGNQDIPHNYLNNILTMEMILWFPFEKFTNIIICSCVTLYTLHYAKPLCIR